ARRGRRVDVLESAMLSQHAALHVVRVDARYFLIGSAAAGVTRLAELRPSFDTGAEPVLSEVEARPAQDDT
ncbi:MAG: FliO/MopB family protein, partial [Candidatus Eremiobacteraeota bacterium]|nr:FliO/MopB family protein [Candidatus Eremiobacteraeota bacterium]